MKAKFALIATLAALPLGAATPPKPGEVAITSKPSGSAVTRSP